MKSFFSTLVFILIIPIHSFANCSNPTDKGFKDCLFETLNAVKEAGKVPLICVANINGEFSKECPPLASKFSDDNGQCDNFISLDGKSGYGPWGKDVLNYLNEKGDQSIFMSKDLKGMNDGVKACPNWNSMTIEQKTFLGLGDGFYFLY